MGEFRFPPPRTDSSNEVVFNLSAGVLPPPTPLLLGLPLVKMVTLPNGVTSFVYDSMGNAGKVYHWTLAPDSNKGLVLICHGAFNGGTNDERNSAFNSIFEDLCTTLASNGFVVVCLRHTPGTGPVAASNDILNTLKYALEDPDKKFSKFKLAGRPIAFVGQSEGGRGAILAAQRVASGEFPQLVKKIKAVVGIAPTVLIPAKGFTDALLILQGTHDGDAPAGGESMRVYEKTAPGIAKFFLWIHGGTHARFLQSSFVKDDSFLDGVSTADKVQRIQKATQIFITKNYVTMFLLLQLAADVKFLPVFVGDADVAWTPPPGPISDDITSGRFRALPLYRLGQGSPIAQDFIVEQMFQGNLVPIDESHPLKIAALNDLHFTLREHHGLGSVVQWNRNLKASPAPKFTVVCNKVLMGLLPKFIEFQAILTALSPQNPGPPPQPAATVAVFLKSGNKKSLPATVIIERSIDLDATQKGPNLNISRSILSTIRIPVSKFGPLPTGFLASADLLLDFSVPPSKTGQVALANFEVSWV